MKRVLLMTAAGLLLAHSAMAGMENCRFALYWKANTTKLTTLCTTYSPNASLTPCTQYVTTGTGGASQVYMVVGRAGTEGLAAASFGVNYHGGSNLPPLTGVDPQFVTVTWCADGLPFPNDGGNGDFPKPKGGVRVTWNTPASCQTTVIGNAGVHAVVGALYCFAYGPDQLQVTPNNNLASGPELAVSDCSGKTTDLLVIWGPVIAQQLMGRVDFLGGPGYNPCLVTPNVPTTWGKIKGQYNH